MSFTAIDGGFLFSCAGDTKLLVGAGRSDHFRGVTKMIHRFSGDTKLLVGVFLGRLIAFRD